MIDNKLDWIPVRYLSKLDLRALLLIKQFYNKACESGDVVEYVKRSLEKLEALENAPAKPVKPIITVVKNVPKR